MHTTSSTRAHSITPFLHHTLFFSVGVALCSLVLFLAAALPGEGSNRKSARYLVEPEEFLRAPLAVNVPSFAFLTDIRFDPAGHLLVADPKNVRTLKFSSVGEFLIALPWDPEPAPAPQKSMYIVNVSPEGLTYAIEPGIGKQIRIYNGNGELQRKESYAQKDFSIWDYVFVNDRIIAASIKEMTLFPQRQLKTRQSIGTHQSE